MANGTAECACTFCRLWQEIYRSYGKQAKTFGIGVNAKGKHGSQMLPSDTVEKIAEEIDILPDNGTAYLNRKTGEVYSLMDDEVEQFEEISNTDSMPQWQRDELPKIQEVLTGDDWLPLPNNFDVHEWSIMKDFSHAIDDQKLRDELLQAIHGNGAFRHFKRIIQEHDVDERWFQFKSEALQQIVAGWLDANGIVYALSLIHI